MIQDIYPHKLINHFEPAKKATPDDMVIHFKGQEVLVLDKENTVKYPTMQELFPEDEEAAARLQYLFTIDDKDIYLARDEEIPVPEGYKYIPRMALRSDDMQPKEMVFANFTAQQLAGWYRDNVYCGTCGSRTFRRPV